MYVDRQSLIVRLGVQLKGYHIVYFQQGDEQTVYDSRRSGAEITEWFKSNKLHATSRRPLYSEYEMYSVCNHGAKKM